MSHAIRKIDYELIEGADRSLKKYHGKWGYYDANNNNLPLAVWPKDGEPSREWINDCHRYFTTDCQDWKSQREEWKLNAVPWLASNYYDDEILLNIEYQYHGE